MHYNAYHFTRTLQKLRDSCVHNQDYPDLYDSLVKRIYFIDAINKAIENLYNNLIDSMKEVEESETIPTPKASTVKRSAPFGFIGSISLILFGTLNEKDGEYYNKKIEELFKGETTLAKLAKEETHIVQHQFASVNKKLHDIKLSMNHSLEIYEKKIVEMDDISDKWHHFEVNRRFTETTNAIETALHLYKNAFQTLTQTNHSARLRHLHPSLLTTNSLQNIIRQINGIHPGYEFPIPIMHARTDKLSEIVSVKLGFRDNNFLA